MDLQQHTARFIASHKLVVPGSTVVVAISGGLDSVVLAHLMVQLGYPVVLAHCNFQLRGSESNRDEAFVRSYAERLGCPLHCETFETAQYAEVQKLSIQEAARVLRYQFFEKIANGLKEQGTYALVATAHHGQDVAETFLMHAARGTGLAGLRGIPIINGHIVRPLWWATPAQIKGYALQHHLTWVEDSSNLTDDYTRNYVRHHVLPALEKPLPQAAAGIVSTAYRMQEAHLLYKQRVNQLLRKGLQVQGGTEKLPVLWLDKSHVAATLLWEWLHPKGFTEGQAGEALKLMEAETGRMITTQQYRLLRNRKWLELTVIATAAAGPVFVEAVPASLPIGTQGAILALDSHSEVPGLEVLKKTPALEAFVDLEKLEWPLLVRPWKQGDYFYPLGLHKKKKVARFLIDCKLSLSEKEQVWVVESGKKIVWVVGLRIDGRVAVTESTRQVLKLTLWPA